jgi:hypothetical protein
VLLLGVILCTIRFLLLSAAKLIWILCFDFPFRQLVVLFSLPLTVVPVPFFFSGRHFFSLPRQLGQDFPLRFSLDL